MVVGFSSVVTRANDMRVNWNSRTRTYDRIINSDELYQLSYVPKKTLERPTRHRRFELLITARQAIVITVSLMPHKRR